MTIRLPQSFSSQNRLYAGALLLDTEILAEKAAALGRTGDVVEGALKALAAHPEKDEVRTALVQAAAEAVLHFFVQRELSGFFEHSDAIRDFKIPKDVLARVGAQ